MNQTQQKHSAIDQTVEMRAVDHAARSIPLAVNLDCLLRTGCIAECLLAIARRRPLYVLCMPWWLLHGRAYFMQRLIRFGMPEFETFPVYAPFLSYLRRQHACGRKIVLVSNMNIDLCQELAMRWTIFDSVVASTAHQYMDAAQLARRLSERYGEKGFDYAGSRSSDRPIWRIARQAVLASDSRRLARKVERIAKVDSVLPAPATRFKDVVNAMRIEHWVKNILVCLPLLAANRRPEFAAGGSLLIMFLSLCLASSSVYLFNDLMDLENDRQHVHNKHRAIASGRLHPGRAFIIAWVLLGGATILALLCSASAALLVAAYILLQAAYSLGAKRIPILDAVVLASGYALRAVGGAIATRSGISLWMVAFCLAAFFSMALIKRYVDLHIAARHRLHAQPGRGYYTADRLALMAQGLGAGYISIPLLAAFVTEGMSTTLALPQQIALLMFCVLFFYWISYAWLRTGRNTMPRDPVVFALRDRTSLALLVAMAPVAVMI